MESVKKSGVKLPEFETMRRITMGLTFRKTARKINRLNGMIVDIKLFCRKSPTPDFLTLSILGQHKPELLLDIDSRPEGKA